MPHLLRAALAIVLTAFLPAHAQKVGSVSFTTPPGWTASVTQQTATLTPAGGPSQGLIVLISDQAVSGDPVVWFAAAVQHLSSDGPVTDQTKIETPSGTSMLIQALTVRLLQGQQQRLYTAVVTGKAASLYVLVAPSSEAIKSLTPALTALIKSASSPALAASPVPAASGGSLSGKATPMPDVRPQNAAQFVAAGGDPKTQVIPNEFRCYREKAGNGLTPGLVMQMLPGGKYRTAYGSGTVAIKKGSGLIELTWTGGPLDKAYGYLNFGDHGQKISLSNVGEDTMDRTLSFECYQSGSRENLALLEFKLKTPAAASYACQPKDDSGKSSGTVEILPNGQYRFSGQIGRYSYDFRKDQSHDWSALEFTGGALDGATSSYSNRDGVREISIYRPSLSCRNVTTPTPISRYGTAKAPPAPKGSGSGLNGAYVHWYTDPLATLGYGGCGGLCWDVLVFDKSGYVFTDEPDAGIDEADCTSTHPNGLPICEIYSVRGGKITIGKEKPVAFKKVGNGLNIDGDTYEPMLKLEGVRLAGTYESKSFVGGVGGGVSGAFQSTLNFLPGGKFSRERSGGVSATFTDTGTASGSVTGGVTSTSQSGSSGSYAVKGYTLTMTYGDGHKEQMFAFALPDKNGKPKLDLLRLGGASYTLSGK